MITITGGEDNLLVGFAQLVSAVPQGRPLPAIAHPEARCNACSGSAGPVAFHAKSSLYS